MKTDITSLLIQLEEHLKQHGAPDWMWPTARHARSEIEYLRRELKEENERLRAALIEIRDACFGGSPAVDGEAWIYERAKKEVGQG